MSVDVEGVTIKESTLVIWALVYQIQEKRLFVLQFSPL
jgi:hypothetical protein